MKRPQLVLPFFVALFAASLNAQEQAATGKVFWRGMIDHHVQLHIKGDTLKTMVLSGNESPEGVYSFTTPLPERAVVVAFVKRKGRSKKVRVAQQPSESNEFTAIVEILDDDGGAKEYQLEIFWR